MIWYPEIKHVTFVLDDVQAAPWTNYESAFAAYVRQCIPTLNFDVVRVSDHFDISGVVAGWWRQQLIKLTLDCRLPGHDWFVVDGDVIFRERIEVRGVVPISEYGDNDISVMSANYVSRLLGVNPGYLKHQGQKVATNPVPFRHLDRTLLSQLRRHVEQKIGGAFVDTHRQWLADQSIVAHWSPPDRMSMTEWELIEVFRQQVRGDALIQVPISAGYSDLLEHPDQYYHTYLRDVEIPLFWFQAQGLDPDAGIWHQALDWMRSVYPDRLK